MSQNHDSFVLFRPVAESGSPSRLLPSWCGLSPSCRLTQGVTPSPFPPTSLHAPMCLNPDSTQKSCIPWQCPRAPCKSVEIKAGVWFCPALSFQSSGDLVSVTISVCSFVKAFPVSESLHSQGHKGSQSGYQPHGIPQVTRDVLPMEGNPGLGKPEEGQARIKHWQDLVQKGF